MPDPSPSPDTLASHPLPSASSRLLAEHQRLTIRAVIVTLSICAPLVGVGVYLREGVTPLLLATLGLVASAWTTLLLFRLGHERLSAHVLITAAMIGSIAAIVAQGTVRSAAVLVLIATVVGAGAFLATRAMLITAITSVVALAMLNGAEQMGMMREPNFEVGWAVWITQTAVLVCVLVSVFYGRQRLTDALLSQDMALTKAKQVEANLRMSEGRFVTLFRSNPAATLVQHAESLEVLDVNDAFVRMFQFPRGELIGQKPPRLWAHSSERRRFMEMLNLEGHVNGFRAAGLRSDGSCFEAQILGDFVQQDSDRLIIAMVLDVSEQESARRALEQSEERFSKAFNFSPLGMTITRISDGLFMEANPANEVVLGYRPSDFLGTNARSAPIWLTEEDRNTYISTLQHQGRLRGYETRMRDKKGAATDVKLWAEMIQIDGEACVLAFTMNVTAEKRREALLLDLAKGVSGDTGMAFFRSLVLHMSQALGANLVIVGEIKTPGAVETVAALFEGELVPNITYALEGTPCSRAVATVGDTFFADQLATRFPTDDFPIGGGYNTYLGVALRDADGSPIGILKALWMRPRDHSPELHALMTIFASRCNAELIRLRRDREIQKLRDTLEQRVNQRTAQLEYLNRELDSFAYTVSHDLKSPLRSIDGFMHILREQMEDRIHPEDGEIIDRVMASASRMGELINDLLALARVSQSTIQRQPLDLSELAREVLRHEQQRDPDRTVDIQVESGLVADCDPHLARIVLENLLGNAWKYTRRQASPRIVFGRMAADAGDCELAPVFCVQDNGAGFDMSRAERLFKPFNRLHSANEFEGSGIGLATVRRIIERHGGHIFGEGHVGQGSSFQFSFGAGSASE